MQKLASRISYIDALRAVLMLLGVVIHAAQIYNPEKSWLIYSVQSNVFFEKIIDAISSFRMPAFFIVSGYFSFLLLTRNSSRRFLVSRFERLIIPLAIGVLTLNIPIALLLSKLGWLNSELSSFLVEGGWRQHLWFLGNLFIYSLFLTLFNAVNFIQLLFSAVSRFCSLFGIVSLIALLPLVHIVILSLNKFGIPIYASFIGVSLYDLMYYLPFFMFGAFLRYDVNCFELYSSIRSVILLVVICIVMQVFKFSLYIRDFDVLNDVVAAYNNVLLAWVLTMICFYVFKRYLNSESKFWKELANSSYSVYIFHQPVIILLGLMTTSLSIPPMLGFLVIVASTFAITMLLHYKLVKRFGILEYIYNGKRVAGL